MLIQKKSSHFERIWSVTDNLDEESPLENNFVQLLKMKNEEWRMKWNNNFEFRFKICIEAVAIKIKGNNLQW